MQAIFQVRDELFGEGRAEQACRIRASFMEIGNAPGVVNEVITDLLDVSKTNLQVGLLVVEDERRVRR